MESSQKNRRLELNSLFIGFLGSTNVYFQPPETIKMRYPCIVYQRQGFDTRYADNGPYTHKTRYQVTLIYKDPDSELPLKIAELPLCRHDRSFTVDNLYHDVYTLYF
ncbi:MAG: tail completion protein [Chaetfec virus UA24_144]|nr:MAG: tail completion protein [Chaetfec virus UA24_144]